MRRKSGQCKRTLTFDVERMDNQSILSLEKREWKKQIIPGGDYQFWSLDRMEKHLTPRSEEMPHDESQENGNMSLLDF